LRLPSKETIDKLSFWVIRPVGAAFMGVSLSSMMADDLPGFQMPLFGLLVAVTIVMVIRLMEESDVPNPQ